MTQPEAPEMRPTLFTRMFGAARYVMTLAVLAVFVGATVLLLDGIFGMGSAVWHRFYGYQPNVSDSVSLRVAVIEAVDVISGGDCAVRDCLWPLPAICRSKAALHAATLAAHLGNRPARSTAGRNGHHGVEHHCVDPGAGIPWRYKRIRSGIRDCCRHCRDQLIPFSGEQTSST